MLDDSAAGHPFRLVATTRAGQVINQTPGIPVTLGPNIRKEASYGYGWFVRTLQSHGEFHVISSAVAD